MNTEYQKTIHDKKKYHNITSYNNLMHRDIWTQIELWCTRLDTLFDTNSITCDSFKVLWVCLTTNATGTRLASSSGYPSKKPCGMPFVDILPSRNKNLVPSLVFINKILVLLLAGQQQPQWYLAVFEASSLVLPVEPAPYNWQKKPGLCYVHVAYKINNIINMRIENK